MEKLESRRKLLIGLRNKCRTEIPGLEEKIVKVEETTATLSKLIKLKKELKDIKELEKDYDEQVSDIIIEIMKKQKLIKGREKDDM